MNEIISATQIEKAKSVMLDILLDIDKICKENKLTYFLTYGTCLGAVRHHGFIPWDDDIDIGMPRPDFERLCHIIDEKHTDKYDITSPILEYKKNFAIYAKIYKKGTVYLEKTNEGNLFPHGIFIDIFPFDYMPDNKLFRSITLYGMTQLTKIIEVMTVTLYHSKYYSGQLNNIKNYGSIKKKYHFYKVLVMSKVLRTVFSVKLMKRIHLIFSRSIKKSSYMTCYYLDKIYKTEDILPVSYLKFENYDLPVPHDPHKYLEIYFGSDYMTPPPPEKRVGGHKVIEIKV